MNIILAIPLFLNWLPVKLNKDEQELYDEYFRMFISKKHFKVLISYAQIEKFYSPIELCTKGNLIKNFIFVSHVSKGSEVNVYKDGSIIGGVSNGNWIGVIDADIALNQNLQDPRWQIDCKIVKASEHDYVKVVLFPVEKLRKVFFKNNLALYLSLSYFRRSKNMFF